ncbi:MAG: flagellar hook capping FlgD N-terminal domain-containing protein [Phycisphaerales bacterium]
MSTVDAISGSGTTAGAPKSAFSELSSEEFVRIIFAELANQDPLAPNDSNQLIQQLANLRSIQSDIDLTAKLKTLVTENQLASAGNLMGTHISGFNERFERVEGLVISISRTADGPVLNLHTGQRVALRNVDEVIDPRLFVEPDPPSDPGDDADPPSPPVVARPAPPTQGDRSGPSVPDTSPGIFPIGGNI